MEKYIVIEQSESYNYLSQVKYFDNKKEAKNFFDEAVEMFDLNSILGKIEIIEEYNRGE